MNKGSVILIITVFLVVLAIFGRPDEIETTENFPYIHFHWTTTEKQTESVNLRDVTRPEIKIESLNARQKIYALGDTVYVDFTIKNTMGIPYNLSVDWLFNNTRYHGWENTSTESYNINRAYNNYASWYPLPYEYKGKWEVHLVVKYAIYNQTFSTDNITNFDVI